MSNFTKLPTNLKPREKLLLLGETQLSDQELIAIILGSGNRHLSVMQVTQQLFEKYHNLAQIVNASIHELTSNDAIGDVKAINLRAIGEISRRIAQQTQDRDFIKTPEDVYALVRDISRYDQEHLIVIGVNCIGEVMYKRDIFVGTVDTITLHPREIFSDAIKHKVFGIILVHNHPSNNPIPSHNDIISTKKLIDIGNFLKIQVLDHMIVTTDSFYSLKEEGDI